MTNQIITDSIRNLKTEASRFKLLSQRKFLNHRIDDVESGFLSIGGKDFEPQNAPGKVVLRNKKGRIIGKQG